MNTTLSVLAEVEAQLTKILTVIQQKVEAGEERPKQVRLNPLTVRVVSACQRVTELLDQDGL